ncbi:MAG: hypothetical protein EA393_11315 [Bacteroidetes bacterium]|nr:MAG: hypothetical protein EA393_11315 [Bacteroidota bacterium]
MKTIYLLFTILALLFTMSCSKNDTNPYDPEEVILTIHLPEIFFDNTFVIIENKETNPVYLELEGRESYYIQRGDSIRGETFNLHFFYHFFEDVAQASSYFAIVPGKEIHITSGTGNFPMINSHSEKTENNTTVEISFSDIPDFDVATRTAIYPGHCHTLSTLEVPCANIGGNTPPVGSTFYVCLQQGDNAAYKMIELPNVSEYTISLAELNSNMKKYSFPKNPDFLDRISVYGYGEIVNYYGGYTGRLGLFSLSNPSIFPGNTIDVFIPDDIPGLTTFDTNLSKGLPEMQAIKSVSYRNQPQVVNNYLLPEVDFSLSPDHTPGDFPQITHSSNDYSYVTLKLASIDNTLDERRWNMVAPGFDYFYAFTFPEKLLEIIPDNDFYRNFFSYDLHIRAETHYDSRFTNYNDAVNHLLNIEDFGTQDGYKVMNASRWWYESEL